MVNRGLLELREINSHISVEVLVEHSSSSSSDGGGSGGSSEHSGWSYMWRRGGNSGLAYGHYLI